jgi:two-component system, OmpR family, response regulator QseB
MRLLLVEDDKMLGESVQIGLQLDGYAVDWVRDGESARQAALTHDYAALLLDLGLPGRDGLDVLRSLRARGNTTPVLIVTARDNVGQRIAGLDAGADDYILKPFDLDELSARVRAVTRRRHG